MTVVRADPFAIEMRENKKAARLHRGGMSFMTLCDSEETCEKRHCDNVIVTLKAGFLPKVTRPGIVFGKSSMKEQLHWLSRLAFFFLIVYWLYPVEDWSPRFPYGASSTVYSRLLFQAHEAGWGNIGSNILIVIGWEMEPLQNLEAWRTGFHRKQDCDSASGPPAVFRVIATNS